MAIVFGHSYHHNRYDYFCFTIGTDCFPMVFPISEPMFGDDFLWETLEQRILRHAQIHKNCAFISALGVKKREKITIIEQTLWSGNIFLQNL